MLDILAEEAASRPRRRARSSEDIVDQIRSAIFEGRLRPGQRLDTEKELARKYRVSRTTVRDAIRVLESAGLIRVQVGAGGGPFVAEPDSYRFASSLRDHFQLRGVSMRELAELRLAVETAAAGHAAERANAADLQAIWDAIQAVDRGVQSAVASADFHLAIARAAHSEALAMVLEASRALMEGVLRELHATQPDMPDVARRMHRQLYSAIAERDRAAAEGLMRQHLEDFRRRVEAVAPLARIADSSAQ